MKISSQPLRSTIIFGLTCGLCFTPLSVGLGHLVYWPKVLIITLWVYVALYSGFLTRWSIKSIKSIIFPLLLILMALPWMDSIILFMVLILGILSWIRSGICFPKNMGKKIVIEAFLGLVAGGLLISLRPTTLLTWALAVWMLFLVQALYFVLFEPNNNVVELIKRDPFEHAREQAESILAGKPKGKFV